MVSDSYKVIAPYHLEKAESSLASQAYLLTCNSRRFYVGEITAELLKGLEQNKSLPDIFENLQQAYQKSSELTLEKIKCIVDEQLIPLGLISSARATTAVTDIRGTRSSYIKASITIIPAKVSDTIATPFRHFFNRYIFASLCVLAVLAYIPYLSRFGVRSLLPWTFVNTLSTLSMTDYAVLYGLLLFGIVVHELGHAAAARRFGASMGEIGLGAYLIFPVFYANVSDCWKLNKYKRIVINLGGVYFQSLVNTALICLALKSGAEVLRYVIVINTFSIVYAMNPFLRFDGYWVLSDLFEVNNLRSQSLRFMKQMIERLRGRLNANNKNKGGLLRHVEENFFLAGYSSLCILFFALLGYVYLRVLINLIYHPGSLVGGFIHWILLGFILLKALLPILRKAVSARRREFVSN